MDKELTAEELELLAAWREGSIGALLAALVRRVDDGVVPGGVASRQIFWSYDRRDPDAWTVAQELRQAGVPIWVDRLELESGVTYGGVIKEAVRSCAGMVLFVHRKPTDYQSREFDDAVFNGKRPLVVVRNDGLELERRFLEHKQLGYWHPGKTPVRALRASGMVPWMERTLAGLGPQRGLIEEVTTLTQRALLDRRTARVTTTDWFQDPGESRTISGATIGMQDVAWDMLARGRSPWVRDVDIAEKTVEERATITLNALVSAADPDYGDEFAKLVQRCRATGLSERSMLRTFAMTLPPAGGQ